MLNAYGFMSARAVHKPLLSKVNMRKRLAFAKAYNGYDFKKNHFLRRKNLLGAAWGPCEVLETQRREQVQPKIFDEDYPEA